MDFGDVLEEWERMKREAKRISGPAKDGAAPDAGLSPAAEAADAARRLAFEAWLDGHAVSDKDSEAAGEAAALRSEREELGRRLVAMVPQATIDLHGMGARDAEAALLAFFGDAARRGFEKVLVVHGKGNHSKEGPVLRRVARQAIEASPWAGRSGPADRTTGGSGALWVAIRKKA